MTKRYKIHEESNLGISFSEGRILTWGDSLVKAWPKGLEKEAEELDCFGEVRCAVSTRHNDKIYVHVTSENVDTEAYEWPSLLEDKNYNLFRFTCDIGAISSLKTEAGFQAVAGAGDFKIKWKNTENEEEVILEGHAAPILDVALDPRGELVASSSCDGDFRLWNLKSKESIFQKKLFTRCSDIEHAKCPATVEFQPKSGDLIAILDEKGAKIYERSDKSLLHEIDDFGDVPKTLSWSRCGKVLAIAAKNIVRFYDATSFAKIHEISSEDNSPITAVCFTDKNVLVGEKSGTLISIPTSDFITKEIKKNQSFLPRPEIAVKTSSKESVGMSVDSENGEERTKNAFVDEEAGEDEDDIDDLEALWEEDAQSEGAPENTETAANINTDDEDGMPMNIDDDSNNAISLNAIRDSVPLDRPRDIDEEDDENEKEAEGGFYSGIQPSKMQKAFQPGESPTYNATRYLCWNSTGIIKGIIDEQRGISSIIVDFHDITVHHSIQIANQNDFVLGDLSERAIVLASKGEFEGEEKKKSIIKVMNFKSWWDKNREWQLELPRREIAECVCASVDTVAVATSERYIRMFSHGGAQMKLLSVPGQIVTISANLEQLFYIYHRAQGFEGEQYLSCGTISSKRSISKKRGPQPLPTEVGLSAGAKLSWAGFTDEGTPATYDTKGIVRIVSWTNRQWLPVANMTSIKKNFKTVDWWYMISINEGNKEIAAVHCQNSTYPETHPRPEVHVMRMNMPLINPKTDIAVQEADLIMNSNITGTIHSLQARGYSSDAQMEELVQKQITKGILKLLLGAIIADADDRGFEICKMLNNPNQIQMAVRLANQKGRVKLAERLNQLARERSAPDSSEEEEEDSEEDEIDQVIEQTYQTTIRSESNMSIEDNRSLISDRSEELFPSRPAPPPKENGGESLARRKAHNPFAKKSDEDNKENEKSAVLDDLPKMELQRSKPKSSREKLANFRNKQKKSGAAAKNQKIQQKISFGKRKEVSTEEPFSKKLKASTTPVSGNTSGSAVATSVTTSVAMDDFAAGSDSD